jgi:hypothetical protein
MSTEGDFMKGVKFLYSLITLFALIPVKGQGPDSLIYSQLLRNGRIWADPHYNLKGNQFLNTSAFNEGALTINHDSYQDIRLRYDILNDEIQMPVKEGIIQLNSELVDSFDLYYLNSPQRFIRIDKGKFDNLSGYVQKLYSGKLEFYVKHSKKIDRPGVNNIPDYFYYMQRMFVIRNSTAYPVKNRRDFLNLFYNEKAQIRHFLRTNNIHLYKNDPWSFVPVMKFLDSISPDGN